VDEPDWLDRRADFLARTFSQPIDQVTEKLTQAEADLHAAASRYDRVVLWFEHDSFDQLNLARCLAQLAETTPARLEMVTLEHYPGATRFIGLGQLPPEALRLLWDTRKPVTSRQTLEGRKVWTLLRQPDPTPLAVFAANGPGALPYLARAVRRHCQELPWIGDGLSLTERIILELLAERSRTIGEVFRDLTRDREPLPWLGDLMLVSIVRAMRRASQSVFDTEDQRLTITPLGLSVLAGEVDWLSLNPPERWLGGVRISPGEPSWRWDDGLGRPSR
jgi:hypothetical protein